jgi:hypothetical protein
MLFNIFIDNILHRLEEANTHPPVIRKKQEAGLLFADDLAVGATTIIGLQRAINCIKDFCEEWSLQINVANRKIVVFKKGGKLGRDKKMAVGGRGNRSSKAKKVKVSHYTPWRRMGERRYSSYSYLTSATRWG